MYLARFIMLNPVLYMNFFAIHHHGFGVENLVLSVRSVILRITSNRSVRLFSKCSNNLGYPTDNA